MMQKYHNMEVDTIIHPPIYTKDYYIDRESSKKFYLYLGRLAKIKRIEEIVEAFNKIDINLLIAGTGELARRLKKKSDDNIELLGFVSDKKKKELFSTCSGFIQNSIAEDFGVTTVEALASGAPVIAVDDGNNPNLIQHRVNGVLFDRPGDTDAFKTSESAEQLQEAINTAENINWDHKKIQQTAEPYDVSNFLSKWEAAIDR
jgi:glycosyltransferase involved in cell wall biosynthesis